MAQRQIRSAPRYQPLRRALDRPQQPIEFGDSLATILLHGSAGIAARALDEYADEKRQQLTITGQIEGVGAGHAAAMAGQPVPEGDQSYYGQAFATGARTGYATALNDKIALEVDNAAKTAGEDLSAFDKALSTTAASFATLPPDLRAAAEVSLSERGREYRGQIEATIAKRQAEVREYASRSALRVHAERAQTAAFAGDSAAAELARREHHASVAALIGRGMSADEAAATIERLDLEIEQQRHLGGFERAVNGGAAAGHAYLARIAGDQGAFRTPDQRDKTLRTMESRLSALSAQEARAEARAKDAQRAREDATFKRMIDAHAAGGLSMEVLQQNRASLSATDYGQLARMVSEPRPARTDPATYADLDARARAGEDVRAEARRAFTQGQLTRENYDHVNATLDRGADAALKDGEQFIRRFVMGSEFAASYDQSQRYGLAMREFEDWAARRRAPGQPPISRGEANAESERIARVWATTKPADVVADPQFLIRGKDGAFDVDATRAATRAAVEAGRLTPGQAAEESRRIQALAEREAAAKAAAEQLKQRTGAR